MAPHAKLDLTGGSQARPLRFQSVVLCCLIAFPAAAQAQKACNQATIKNLYNKARWTDVLRASSGCALKTADGYYYRGMAFARLQQWELARAAFKAGEKKYPRDRRFAVELAGIAFTQKRYQEAERDLRRTLHLSPHDPYAINFLATLYFLQGNQEAALKYWNRIGKPWINQIKIDPQLRVDPALLSRALTCSPASLLTLEQYRTTLERLKQLEIFPAFRLDLVPLQGKGRQIFDLKLSAVERSGWGPGRVAGLLSLLRGLPYETVYPEVYNLHDSAMNVTSLFRWNDQERRVFVSISAPLAGSPRYRYRLYADGRNENWNISRTFHQAGLPIKAFNLEKLQLGGRVKSIVNSRWSWAAGLSLSDRRYRNLPPGTRAADPIFSDGFAVETHARSNYALLLIPGRRFSLDSSAMGTLGNFYASGFGHFGMLQGLLRAQWFPRPRGDDYEMTEEFHAGKTFGLVPFDDFFMLGLERDNNLPLRAHIGTRNGQKGNAPLGRDYLLSNWEVDKNLYANAWFKVRLAPFLDTGKIYDGSGGFGSQQWLWDTGASVKLRFLGGVSLVFTYGKDLRTGDNTFYFTTTSQGAPSLLP